jgi:PIN domain nuclease of toxin-antitoxin system
MTLLLDTHTFLWYCQDDAALSTLAKEKLEDPGNRKLVSMATCWEIAIKAGLGKLSLGEPSRTYIPNALARTGFDLLPISLSDATAVEALPQYHRDPFDRMIIAQAMAASIPVVGVDVAFDHYGVTRLW